MLYFLAICIFLLVLFAALLFYVTREQTFEQALEEQRNKHDDLLTPTNIITGDNNDKIGRKDRAKKLNLNKKSTKTVANKQQNVSNKIQPKSNNNEKIVVSSSVDVGSSAAEESNESKVLKLDDHRKSKESISTVTAPAATAAVATANAIPLSVPEDKVDAVVVPVVERPIKANQSIKNQSSAKIPVVKQDNSTVAINKPNNNSSNNVPVTNGKKSKKSNVSKGMFQIFHFQNLNFFS